MAIGSGRRLVAVIVLAVGLTRSFDSFGLSVLSTKDQLLTCGLPVEPTVLVDYLRMGIPADVVPENKRARSGALQKFDRWRQYRIIVEYLGESRHMGAVPVLLSLIDEDLPEALQHDLDIHVVGHWHYHTFGEWDSARERGTVIFRSTCAGAVLRLESFQNEPELRAHLLSQSVNLFASKSRAGQREHPNPQSLRDHVALADERRQWMEPGVHWPSVEWLNTSGAEQIRGFRRIAKDRTETPYVRGEALYWYAKFRGERSRRLLRKYAVGNIRSVHKDDETTLQRRALGLMAERFPEHVDAVARMAVLHDGSVARDALRILSQRSRNYPFLAGNIESVSPEVKRYVVETLAGSESFCLPSVFFDAIRSQDLNQAVYGYSGIRRFNLTEDLDVRTASAVARWKSNPEFLVELLGTRSIAERPEVVCQGILNCVEGTDVQASRIYRRLYDLLNMPPGVIADYGTANAFSAEAWDGLMRCASAYHASDSG